MNPEEDGVTHINVYSKGRTELGRLLTNFAHTPFVNKHYGAFQSVEGFWYYSLLLGNLPEGYLSELRKLYGYKAKKHGKELIETINPITDMGHKERVREAISDKLRQNKHILRMLLDTNLPLEHYYVYGDSENYKIVSPDEHRWIIDHIEYIRKRCKEKGWYPQ